MSYDLSWIDEEEKPEVVSKPKPITPKPNTKLTGAGIRLYKEYLFE